jgi:hypothetical protein
MNAWIEKRLEEWGEWMGETLLQNVPHRQVVSTIFDPAVIKAINQQKAAVEK